MVGIQIQILILVQQMLYQLSHLSCPSDYLKVFLSYISTLDINSLSYIQIISPILLISSVHCLLSCEKSILIRLIYQISELLGSYAENCFYTKYMKRA